MRWIAILCVFWSLGCSDSGGGYQVKPWFETSRYQPANWQQITPVEFIYQAPTCAPSMFADVTWGRSGAYSVGMWWCAGAPYCLAFDAANIGSRMTELVPDGGYENLAVTFMSLGTPGRSLTVGEAALCETIATVTDPAAGA